MERFSPINTAPITYTGGSINSIRYGMSLGLAHGSKMAGLRFRAEHAHRLPTTTTGWYLYHKSKNYHLAFGGLKEGFKVGARLSVLSTAMFCAENLFDVYRGTKDLFSTVMASLAVAGGFSFWSMFRQHHPWYHHSNHVTRCRSIFGSGNRENREKRPHIRACIRRRSGSPLPRERSTSRLCRVYPQTYWKSQST